MTKTKQQLRAEAVERLRGLGEHVVASSIQWALFGPERDNMPPNELRDALIDLLTDDCDTECYECAKLADLVAENSQLRERMDELANGNDGETNGIADGSPLVEPCTSEGENVQGLPDENVSYLLRDVAKKSDGHTLYHGATKLMQAIGKEPEDRRETGSELAVALNTLADMVERDYVSREAYEDLRDEFVWETTFLHRIAKKCGTKDVPSLVAYVEQLEAKVDELETDVSQAVEDTAERVTKTGENVTHDSREELEADANGYVMSWWQSDRVDSFGHANSMKRDIMRLLDRQAAITERHILTRHDERDEQIAELTAELERETLTACNSCAERIDLQARVDELTENYEASSRALEILTSDKAELQMRVDELTRENAKLSDDEFYLRCTLVDMNGEVVS